MDLGVPGSSPGGGTTDLNHLDSRDVTCTSQKIYWEAHGKLDVLAVHSRGSENGIISFLLF